MMTGGRGVCCTCSFSSSSSTMSSTPLLFVFSRCSSTKLCRTATALFYRRRPTLPFPLATDSRSVLSSAAATEEEVAEGYNMTQFCDKMIDVLLHDKPHPNDWRKLLLLSHHHWTTKYSRAFHARCELRAQQDPIMKPNLLQLHTKILNIEREIQNHNHLLQEIQQNPTDINAIVAKRRNDFNSDFFRHLNLLSEINDTSLEDRDVITRIGAKCLSAVRAYDSATENLETLDAAQAKFDDILNSPSLDEACRKLKSMAKAKELDSSLILLINRSWAAAKDSTTMKTAVKDIMYQIYKTTKSSIKSIAPKEVKLLKYLLNITDPEERFSALASAFSPGNEHEAKDEDALYSTPKELHKWIKIMLDAYQLNKEECDLREARNMTDPVVIQRFFILKETIEEEYLKLREKSKEGELE